MPSKATILDGINQDLGEILVEEQDLMYDNTTWTSLLGVIKDEDRAGTVKVNRKLKNVFRDKDTSTTNQGASAISRFATIKKDYPTAQNASIIVPKEYSVARPKQLLDYVAAESKGLREEMISTLSQQFFDNIASKFVTANAIVYSALSADPGTSGNISQVVVPIAELETSTGSGVLDGRKLNEKLTELTTTLSIKNDVFGKGIKPTDMNISVSPTGNGALSTSVIYSNNRFLDDIAKNRYTGAVGWINGSPTWVSIELEFVIPKGAGGVDIADGKVEAVIYADRASRIPNFIIGTEVQTRPNFMDLQVVMEWSGMPMITKPERIIQLVVDYSAALQSGYSTRTDETPVTLTELEKLEKQKINIEAWLSKKPNNKQAINALNKVDLDIKALQNNS